MSKAWNTAAVCALAAATAAWADAVPRIAQPPEPYGPIPDARQLAWQEIELRATLSVGLGAYTTVEVLDGSADPTLFNPLDFDAQRVVVTLKALGVGGITVPARRADGYRLWPSSRSPHTIAQATWRDGAGDYVGEVAKACAAAGMPFGLSLAADDWSYLGPDDGYTELFAAEARELVERYGPVAALRIDCGPRAAQWTAPFDGEAVLAGVRQAAPDTLVASPLGPDLRTLGVGDGSSMEASPGAAGERSWSRVDGADSLGCALDGLGVRPSREGRSWCPAVATIELRQREFFRRMDEKKLPSPAKLEALWFDTVGRGMTLDLGVPPMARGILHPLETALLQDLHRAIGDTFATDLARSATVGASNVRQGADEFSAARATDGDRATYWATDDGTREAWILLEWKTAQRISCVRIEEQVALGQRVTGHRIEARVGGAWREVHRGDAIGVRRIARFPFVDADAVRIALAADAAPVIRHVGVHCEAPRVTASREGGPVAETATVEFSSDWPDAVIRCTVDGTVPTEKSPIASGPIAARGNTVVQARAFAAGRASPYPLRLEFQRPKAVGGSGEPAGKSAR